MILAADIGGTTCKLGILDSNLNIIKNGKSLRIKMITEHIY